MKRFFKKYSYLLMAFIVAILGFSSVVYAGFTKQYNPEISSFSINISSQEHMMISTTGMEGSFGDIIRYTDLFDEEDVELLPLTGKVSWTEDDTYQVLSLTNRSMQPAEAGSYIAFDLYFVASSDMDLYLAGNTSGTVISDPSDGHITFTEEQKAEIAANMRIAFMTYKTSYQDSETGTTISYSASPIATNVYSKVAEETAMYKTFCNLGYSGGADDTKLASVNKNEVTKIRVAIWLEDRSPTLEAICKLAISLRFQAVPRNS